MGRSASYFTLGCTLKIRPNIYLIGEEVDQKNQNLDDTVIYIATLVKERADNGMKFDTSLIPEFIEYFPTNKKLIQELKDVLATNTKVR